MQLLYSEAHSTELHHISLLDLEAVNILFQLMCAILYFFLRSKLF